MNHQNNSIPTSQPKNLPQGGTGAVSQHRNVDGEYEKKPPTIFFATPGCSSLPYLDMSMRVKHFDEEFELRKDIEHIKADWVLHDKIELQKERGIRNLVGAYTTSQDIRERKTEELLRGYLENALLERNKSAKDKYEKSLEGMDEAFASGRSNFLQREDLGLVEPQQDITNTQNREAPRAEAPLQTASQRAQRSRAPRTEEQRQHRAQLDRARLVERGGQPRRGTTESEPQREDF